MKAIRIILYFFLISEFSAAFVLPKISEKLEAISKIKPTKSITQ